MGIGTGRKLRRTLGIALLLALPVLAIAGTGAASASELFELQTTQSVKGSAKGFTEGPLVAPVGDSIEYRIFVRNGEDRHKFREFSQKACDPGTLKGGPGEVVQRPNQVTFYKCTHKVTLADQEAGVIEQNATINGYRPAEPTNQETQTSDTVVVNVPPGTVAPKFASASATCSSVTVNFTGFPEWTGNEVKEVVRVDNVLAYEANFLFNGASGSNTTPLTLSSGAHSIAIHAAWNTNGVKGGGGHTVKVTCP
jgi:hypothetical protein